MTDTEAPVEEPVEIDEATKRRAGISVRDMVISMAVLLVPILILFTAAKLIFDDDPAIDPGPTFRAAGAQFVVVTPHDLPEGWRAVTASVNGGTLRVGYVTPSDGALQLVETKGDLEAALGTGSKKMTGTETIGGASWQMFIVGDSERALVKPGPVNVIVIGRGSPDELRTLAGSLR